MADGDDENEQLCVPNLVNDAIIPDSNAVKIVFTGKFYATWNTRICAEVAHCLRQTPQ